jgi:four helix bundle protein
MEGGGRRTGDGGRETREDGVEMVEVYKFQKLQVYQCALAYVDAVYEVSRLLPEREKFNLSSQIERAATSIVLNIAEGSTGQTDAEQNRFLGLALRSYLETIACCDLIERRAYLSPEIMGALREQGHDLFIKISAFRKALR